MEMIVVQWFIGLWSIGIHFGLTNGNNSGILIAEVSFFGIHVAVMLVMRETENDPRRGPQLQSD